ncbi:two-component sensor histidine kinase [Rhizobium pusense]|uniref:ATP-binding protein n=1 Tax=Agrobacterium pusense TaxID=648995 RepID=UPI001C6EC8CF|nr:ATP-binding protein [Agrobacterium pusense]MBW9080747.1 two-component sensor histidine kinase [Agrobacterium pusense]
MNRLRSASIRTQILVLALLLTLLVSIVAVTTEPFINGRHDKGIQIGLMVGHIERVVDGFRGAQSANEISGVLRLAEQLDLSVEVLSMNEVPAADTVSATPATILKGVREALEEGFFHILGHLLDREATSSPLYVRIDEDQVLLFHLPTFPRYLWFFPAAISGILKIILPLTVLAYVSSWLITRPLIRFAADAQKASSDDSLQMPFTTKGASELRSLATSLNVMRGRILEMAEARTRMLSGMSHDLRTPLTRLRMRAERCEPPELQKKMIEDLKVLDSMIDEALAFLSSASYSSPSRKVDLSSLLQTIATDFCETGTEVSFSGPRRLKFVCKPQAITRAVSNLVENASRYGTKVEIKLEETADGGVVIRVSDNGPGLTDDLKAKVLQPFFKVEEARTAGTGGGFGLGLPTAEGIIRKGHGGRLALLDANPHGLVAEISLPPAGSRDERGLVAVSCFETLSVPGH